MNRTGRTIRRSLSRLFTSAGLVAAGLFAAWEAAPAALSAAEADRDVQNLVLLAPTSPLFIQVRLQVDGHGLKAVREAFAAQIVKNYDKDADGVLNRDEAKNVPPLVKSPTARDTILLAERWEAVDLAPADDKVSADELGGYLDRVFGNTFELSVKPQRASQGVDLIGLLDLNHDGRLSRQELAAAARTLRKLDLDEDEAFTIEELQPFRNPQLPNQPVIGASAATDQPFLLFDNEATATLAVEKILQRYGQTPDPKAEPSIERRFLPVSDAAFAEFDQNADGTWNKAELQAFLKRPEPQLVLEAQLGQAAKGKARLTVVDDRMKATTADTKTGRVTLSAAGVGLQMHVSPNRSNLKDSRALIRTTKFKSADGDKNGYLSEAEFPALGLPDADFKTVDRNSDGMVTLDEILAYIDQESAASQSRIEMVISHDGKSVFEVMDQNNDRRLSRRELAHGFERLKAFDVDGDDSITAVELAGRFRADLGLGKPVLFRNQPMNNRGDTTAPIIQVPSAGPDWFRKMDRNRDGDVSQREFLGPLSLFNKLDLDHDGLITATEAEQAAPQPAANPESAPAGTSAATRNSPQSP
ncbi:MAG: hypothetical protein JSS02_30060 [Planctomycetes bacterium]|nr:hypothetical protein [Planctomycetota bacterium]